MQVYYDTFYKTFLFVPLVGAPVAFRGSVTNKAGKPVQGVAVSASAGGITYHTFTDSKGRYRILGNISGPVSLQTGSTQAKVSKIPAGGRINLSVQ
jgi:hypothetical protein